MGLELIHLFVCRCAFTEAEFIYKTSRVNLMKVLRHVHLRHVYGQLFFLFKKTYIQEQKHYGIKLLCGYFFRILFSFLSFSAVFFFMCI